MKSGGRVREGKKERKVARGHSGSGGALPSPGGWPSKGCRGWFQGAGEEGGGGGGGGGQDGAAFLVNRHLPRSFFLSVMQRCHDNTFLPPCHGFSDSWDSSRILAMVGSSVS